MLRFCPSVQQRGGCSNRAQRRPSNTDRQVDQNRNTDRDTDGLNRTKGEHLNTTQHALQQEAPPLPNTCLCVSFSTGDVQLRSVRRLRRRALLRPVPDGEAVPADPGGGRCLPAAEALQAAEEPGPLRLRHGPVLRGRGPGRTREEQESGGVRGPASADPKEDPTLREQEDDGGAELLRDSRNFLIHEEDQAGPGGVQPEARGPSLYLSRKKNYQVGVSRLIDSSSSSRRKNRLKKQKASALILIQL